jgi:hypothetical protein
LETYPNKKSWQLLADVGSDVIIILMTDTAVMENSGDFKNEERLVALQDSSEVVPKEEEEHDPDVQTAVEQDSELHPSHVVYLEASADVKQESEHHFSPAEAEPKEKADGVKGCEPQSSSTQVFLIAEPALEQNSQLKSSLFGQKQESNNQSEGLNAR